MRPAQASLKTLVSAIHLLLVVATTPSMASDVDRESRDMLRLIDPTCVKLNFTFRKMKERPFYRETVFELKDNGEIEEHMALIFAGNYIYRKLSHETTWDRLNMIPPYWQPFTSCTPRKVEGAAVYYATYHRDGHLAGAEVWTTEDGETITKLVRRYPSDDLVFPFPTAVSIFDYRREAVDAPEHYTCGGARCRLFILLAMRRNVGLQRHVSYVLS